MDTLCEDFDVFMLLFQVWLNICQSENCLYWSSREKWNTVSAMYMFLKSYVFQINLKKKNFLKCIYFTVNSHTQHHISVVYDCLLGNIYIYD